MKKAVMVLAVLGLAVAALMFGSRAKAVDLLDYEIAFFNNGTCTGDDYIKIGRGEFPDFRSLQNAWKDGAPNENWNDKISCVQLGSMAKVTVYQDIKFKGKSRTINYAKDGEKVSFAGDWWNDRVSSAKVQ